LPLVSGNINVTDATHSPRPHTTLQGRPAAGLAYADTADRVYGLRSMSGCLAWSVLSFLFFWDMLLPIARDGAPFRPSAVAPGQFVAPSWTWILGFTALGVATGACYRRLRMREAALATTTTAAAQAA
jgi:hypothetical protein